MPTETPLSRGSLFPPELVTEMIDGVKGHSSLARLSNSVPIPFNGRKEFIFTLDKEIDVVAENGAKSHGGATVTPVTIIPVKVEYGMRVSDEFMYASAEERIDVLRRFNEGFSKKVARGLDIMAFHGVNPRTGSASNVIGDNHFDEVVDQITEDDGTSNADAMMEAAIALVQANDFDVTGAAFAPAFRSALSAMTTIGGAKMFPNLAWGNAPGEINGLTVDTNSTVSFGESLDLALVGDFQNYFRWGFSKEIPMKVIEYGNPDNDATLGDLQGHNQVYIRAEAYIGWGILDADAFAWIKTEEDDAEGGGAQSGGGSGESQG